MPKKSTEYSRGREERTYDPRKIAIDPELRGRTFASDELVKEKYDSIRSVGQIDAIGIRLGHKNEPIVVYGTTRLLAMQQMAQEDEFDGKPIVSIRCVLLHVNEKEAFEYAILENQETAPPNDVDHAYNIRRLITNYAHTEESVSKLYRKPHLQWVQEHLEILKLEEKYLRQIISGELSFSVALTLSRVDPQFREAALANSDRTSTGKVTRAALASSANETAASHRRGRPPTNSAATTDHVKGANTASRFKKLIKEESETEVEGPLQNIYLGILAWFKDETDDHGLVAPFRELDRLVWEGKNKPQKKGKYSNEKSNA